MAKILVTTARNMYGLNTIRILSAEGHEVFAADSIKLNGGAFSKYVKKSFVYPEVSKNAPSFVELILDFVEQENIEYIIPSFEEAYVLSYYKEKFKNKVKMLVEDYEKLMILHDKYTMTQLSKQLGIDVPRTILLKDFRRSEWNFPFVLKPRKNRAAMGIKKIDNEDKLKKILKKINIKNYMVQQYIDHKQYCTTGIAYNGKLIGNVIYKNLREFPESGGFGTYRVSCDIPEIIENVNKLVSELEYTGFICVDHLHDSKTGRYYITDVNPRMSPGLYTAYMAGVNLPKMYIDLIDKPQTIKEQFAPAGHVSYTGFLELGWILSVLFKGKFRSIKDYFKQKKVHGADDVWDKKDVVPAFITLFTMLYSAIFGPFYKWGDEEIFLKKTFYEDKYFQKTSKLVELERKYCEDHSDKKEKVLSKH
ncbi:MAG: ATP-grasp domain-containing protein [Kosmotoga sp.]|nr:MAG: ATP-grasp domain-containing protein [Kosmotoga sp.]